jgi:hypothetical protein
MSLTILVINILLSDQYGTTENKVVGVFDNDEALQSAKEAAAKRCRNSLHSFYELRAELNAFLVADPGSRSPPTFCARQ